MIAALKHGGPDAESTFFGKDDRIAFGFRRRAIVDLVTGSLPIRNEDGNVISMLNREIYNHVDLRVALSNAAGFVDIEIEWGPSRIVGRGRRRTRS